MHKDLVYISSRTELRTGSLGIVDALLQQENMPAGPKAGENFLDGVL